MFHIYTFSFILYCLRYQDIRTSFQLHTIVLFTDLQNVNITLRILFRPVVNELPKIYTNLGLDYDDRVLPSITNEVLKAVVVSGERILNILKLTDLNFSCCRSGSTVTKLFFQKIYCWCNQLTCLRLSLKQIH